MRTRPLITLHLYRYLLLFPLLHLSTTSHARIGWSGLDIFLGLEGSHNSTTSLFARPIPDVPIVTTNLTEIWTYIIHESQTPIPLPYWNATLNGMLNNLTAIANDTVDRRAEYEPLTANGTARSCCYRPSIRRPLTAPRASSDDKCLYFHTSSLNNTVKYGVSYSQSLQEEYGYDPIEYYPQHLDHSNLWDFTKALRNATGTPLDFTFEVISPLFSITEKVFAIDCVSFDERGCVGVEGLSRGFGRSCKGAFVED